MEDSPAEDAGLKSGDVIVAVNGHKITSTGQLRSQIGMIAVGEKATLTIMRDGDEKRIKVKVGKRNALANVTGKVHKLLDGVRFENDEQGKGVRVTSIVPNSNAAYSGLRPRDVIVAANKRRVYDIKSLEKALSTNKSSVLLQVNRGGGSLFIVIR